MWHWVLHLLHLQPTRVVHEASAGHEWVFFECTMCRATTRIAHSAACECGKGTYESADPC